MGYEYIHGIAEVVIRPIMLRPRGSSKLRKLLILIAAAFIGWMYYKAQHAGKMMRADKLDEPPVSSYAGGGIGGVGLGGIGAGGGALSGSGLGGGGIGRGAVNGSGIGGGSGQPPGYTIRETSVDRARAKERAENTLRLLDAAAKGDNDRLATIVSDNVTIDGRDGQRRTALMYAAWNGHNDTCAKLLRAGANIRFLDREGNSALDYAAGRGLVETVTFLLQRTNSTDEKHALEYASLMKASYASNPALLPQAARPVTINRIAPEGGSPLHVAASNGVLPMVEELVSRGADVNLNNADKRTPLHWAAWNNRAEVIAYLLDQKAGMNATDSEGVTPLMLAAENNAVAAVKLLLERGADRRLKNKKGQTALFIAEDKNNADIITLLQ